MDPSSSTSTPRPTRVEQTQSTSSTRSVRALEKEKEDRPKIPLPARGTRYKDKFHELREKYESVTQRQRYEHELAVANAKIRKLQNECNLLLDAVDIAAPSQDNISYYLKLDPVPPQYEFRGRNITIPPPPPIPMEGIETATHPREITNGTNGHAHRR
ncbi:unnamed protein product [Somion occarium]|uniref:Uncharacterized protein n=1 Tax=Somion occarium TaxID=3059160 RepID=A0ABP1E442_9APHY